MASVISQLIQYLTGAIVDLAKAVGEGINQMAVSAFLEVDADTSAITGLSSFGGLVAVFAGVALAIGLTTRVFLWITSLGHN